jgi:hypothetical protein
MKRTTEKQFHKSPPSCAPTVKTNFLTSTHIHYENEKVQSSSKQFKAIQNKANT